MIKSIQIPPGMKINFYAEQNFESNRILCMNSIRYQICFRRKLKLPRKTILNINDANESIMIMISKF